MTCAHDEFDTESRVARIEDIGRFVLELKIKCKQCGAPFQFIGIEPGFSYEYPTVRLDGLEVDLPICQQGTRPTPIHGLMGYTITGTN